MVYPSSAPAPLILRRRDELRARATRLGRWLVDSRMRRPIPFIILSYPRSGNHWVRYIMEWTTGAPTLGAGEGEHWRDRHNPADRPIHERTDLPEVGGPPVGKKRHLIQPWDRRDAGLVFVLRDPLRCIPRHLATMTRVDREVQRSEVGKYLQALRSFDQWPSSRLLLDYDELTESPEGPIGDLVRFVGGEDQQAVEFLRDLEAHRANSLSTLLEPAASEYPSPAQPLGARDDVRMLLTSADPDLATRYLSQWL